MCTPLINKYQINKLCLAKTNLTNSIDADILAIVKCKDQVKSEQLIRQCEAKIKELELV